MPNVTGVPEDLLTGPPDKEAQKLQAAVEATDIKRVFANKGERDELKRHIIMLRDSEVWAVFTAYFKKEGAQLDAFVVDSSNPSELLKYSGELKMLKKVMQWSDVMLGTIEQLNKHEAKQKEMEDARRNQEGPARSK